MTIKKLHARGCDGGIQADAVRNLMRTGVDGSKNQGSAAEKPPLIEPDSQEPDYGGGIILRAVAGAKLQGVSAHDERNGIALSRFRPG